MIVHSSLVLGVMTRRPTIGIQLIGMIVGLFHNSIIEYLDLTCRQQDRTIFSIGRNERCKDH